MSIEALIAQQKGEQHPLIADYIRVNQQLQKERQLSKSTSSKVTELRKKLSCLEFIRRSSEKQSLRYQRQLEKLSNTQDYATQLLKLKQRSMEEMQEKCQLKREQCVTQRDNLWRNRKISQSVYDQHRDERIQRSRELQERVSQQARKKKAELERSLHEQKEGVRTEQLRLRERRQRYEKYKREQALLNYEEKVQKELAVYTQRKQYLLSLKSKFQQEQQVFRRTQILESIYLTGQPND